MRTGGACATALLLLGSLIVQVASAEDIYWEGQDGEENEFLEVKEEPDLRRIKRDWGFNFNPLSLILQTSSTTEVSKTANSEDAVTEDQEDNNDYDNHSDGSGALEVPEKVEPEPGEKTLRVSFVVMEPFLVDYSNRDSEHFQKFSHGLAKAVNALFNDLSGTQKASLVRIQSRVSDNFSCKVTLDILTTVDNTEEMSEILRDHIRNTRSLGDYTVTDADFSANVVNPGSPFEKTCESNELQCSDGKCVAGSSICDRIEDCSDGADERECPTDDLDQGVDDSLNRVDEFQPLCDRPIPCASSAVTICPDQRCNGVTDCPGGEDEDPMLCSPPTTPRGREDSAPYTTTSPDYKTTRRPVLPDIYDDEACLVDEFRCDETRCISLQKVCDQELDCSDGTDEATCGAKQCGVGDFVCNNGACIEGSRRCDRVFDCAQNEDEFNCQCTDNEFRCNDRSLCIESRKRCDGEKHCNDGSDEIGCSATCAVDQWQCDHGHCIKRSKRCNGRIDCPSDRSDERNCAVFGYFKCLKGKVIAQNMRCNRRYDCPPGDYSDEQNCPCGDDDFKCANGHCIQAVKRCDRTRDCQDGSDEHHCNYGTDCMAYEYKCTSGQCVDAESFCNGTVECNDGSDENKCPCKRGQFPCRDGSCINIALRCNGHSDCRQGEDELNCGVCPSDTFACPAGSRTACAKRCDGRSECDGGEDELDCDCQYGECDGRCIEVDKFCDGIRDCSNGADEINCDNCDRPDDFRCEDQTCIPLSSRCNNVTECPDNSDEWNCDNIITATKVDCPGGGFKCDDGGCISKDFVCDGNNDCIDDSDEKNCPRLMARASRSPPAPCLDTQFTCYDGRCIPEERRCDNIYDCLDFSDEQRCHSACQYDQFQCENSQCIHNSGRCNGVEDCADGSDESPDLCELTDDEYNTESPYIYPSAPVTTTTEAYNSGTGDVRKTYSPYAPRSNGSQTRRYYPTDRPESNRPSQNEPRYNQPSQNRPVYNQPSQNGPGYNQGTQNGPDYNQGSQNRPVYNQPSQNGPGYNQGTQNGPDYNQGSQNRPDYNQVSQNRPDYNQVSQNRPDYNQGSQNRPDYNQGSQNRPEYNRPSQNGPGYYPPSQNGPDYNRPSQSGPDYNRPTESSWDVTPGYPSTTQRHTYPDSPGLSGTGSGQGETGPCKSFEWRCENGPCIDARRRCDGHIDCPFDFSDEFDCPAGSPISLNVKTYPNQQSVRFGGDVVFTCRDEGPLRAAVRWVRENGRPLKPDSTDRGGRLEMYKVTTSDSGVYICQTPKYLAYPGSQERVTLTVNRPENVAPTRAPTLVCKPYEATCSNGECIPKEAVCDRKVDCSDRSDEDMCPYNGVCEPNQFQCGNRKCVLRSWLCDSDDDCGDGSDEKNCPSTDPQAPCASTEFACHSGTQCVPRSFHCDGPNDCLDGSDEVGCSEVYISKPPKPANVKLNPGETLVLTCEAVGVPVPIISWRRNWGHVPPKCVWTNENGVGSLTCPNMLPEDNGAYSCEAMNNKGTTFATPDSIVIVTQTDPCPNGYFNDEARSQNDCIRCFCFGRATQCHSADLFTYHMPTPLGEGGTRLLGVALSGDGEVRFDPSIVNHYYYQAMRNGATVTKLEYRDESWLGNFHPYLSLPETYNGNQLTSYGGHIKYTLQAHTYALQQDDVPAIIVKGKYTTLYHVPRIDISSPKAVIEARFVPESWEKADVYGNFIPATREDIMMALDAVERILLRADNNNAGVNITDFVMESAHSLNSGLGAANLVEECACPEGYEGLSCEKCKPGYIRENSGPWLGQCVRKPCPAGTYGDPSTGSACLPCPCPLTNKDNQFATTCALDSDGSVTCDCFSGYEGRTCEKCAEGYEGNPLIAGNKCSVPARDYCNPIGTRHKQLLNECVCKESVEGRFCDQCKNDSFYLSNDFKYGCARCFCSGESQVCMSSNLRRKTTELSFNVPAIVDQVKVYHTVPQGSDTFRYTAPVETSLKPSLGRGGMRLSGMDRSRPSVYYWSMPASFAGNKVTSYGGYLRYTLDNVPTYVDSRLKNMAADVQLISENHLTFQYFGNFQPSYEGTLNVSIQLMEKGWQRSDGKEVPREYFLLALADVKTILIKATYSSESIATPLYASIETATADATGAAALHVEQCVCPPEHIGTSCEDCAVGYTRGASGLYLNHCEACECNGHSKNCHPETGQCYECMDNTDGPRCELCKDGYERDGYDNCIRVDGPSTTNTPCHCDPRGEAEPCSEDGVCACKRNVEGENCDRCREGTFGLDASNPDGCTPCFCSGASTSCYEANYLYRAAIPAPIFGDRYGGYTIMNLDGDTVVDEQFVPVPDKSELMYVFPFPADQELYWSLPVFPGNRVLSYGGYLWLRQEFKSNNNNVVSQQGNDVILVGDGISVAWYNPNVLLSEQSLNYQVPLREAEWTILNKAVPATRSDFMRVLKNLRRVLVKATLAENIVSTSIADVAMDTATEIAEPNAVIAKGVEMCTCAPGHQGTSCETCSGGYYRNEQDYCTQCPCHGHECQLDAYGQLVCNCRPPYTGTDCSAIGLVMELHPTLREDIDGSKRASLTCKYRAPEPLTIQFMASGREFGPARPASESTLHPDGWHGSLTVTTAALGASNPHIYECRTITHRGETLGVLFADLEGGQPQVTTVPPLMPQGSMTARIINHPEKITIKEIGSSVNFTCQAQSQYSSRVSMSWRKVDGNLPQGRYYTDEYSGVLLITNLQISDSGMYICQTTDGRSSGQVAVTLKVPANEMVLPTVEIRPPVKEYYAGERIELECVARGSPRPSVSWQRASRRPLPLNSEQYENMFLINSAREEDSGEYRCMASNTVGSADGTAVITVRARPSRPARDRLVVSPSTPSVDEGQSTRLVCTGSINVPAGTIDWVRQDGDRFQANVRSDNGVLYIEGATRANAGVYVCQTDGAEVDPEPVLLTVIPLATISPAETPEVTINVQSLRIPSGGSDKIECHPRGTPTPLIRWSKYEGQMGPGVSQRGDTLIFNEAEESDAGYYVCEGIDRVDGHVVHNVYLYIDIEKRQRPVVEVWPGGEQGVALGDTQFEFQCRVLAGLPPPDVTWSRAGGRALSAHVEIKPNNILKFDKIEVNDEGEYICTGDNVAGSASASGVLKVRSPPEIVITPTNDLRINIGEPAALDCRAEGYPEPQIIIRGPDGNELVTASRIASLRIASATERDDGAYTCIASNQAGIIEESFLIRVERDGDEYETTEEPRPHDPTKPLEQIVFVGHDISIYCNVSYGYDPTWDRADQRPLQENARQYRNELIIKNVTKNDSGVYLCSAHNYSTREVQVALYTNIRVLTAPKVVLRPEIQTVQPGQSPTVECIVQGDLTNTFDIIWRPTYKPFSSRVRVRNATLIFQQIEGEDAGKYECIARNQYANASAMAEVIVKEERAVSLSSHSHSQRVQRGNDVELSCNLFAPGLSIRWTKDGWPLPASVSVHSDGSLFIRLARPAHSGRYECLISDARGRLSSDYIDLHIEGIECSDSEFRCNSADTCIDEELVCDGYADCSDRTDEENCLFRDKRYSPSFGTPEEALVMIKQPHRSFRAGENVEVLCSSASRDVNVEWIKRDEQGNRQYVDSNTFGGGAMLKINTVGEEDAGIYQCIGRNRFGLNYTDNFILEVVPGSSLVDMRGRDVPVREYLAPLRSVVDMPCAHDLEDPVSIQWRKEYSSLPPQPTSTQPILHINSVTEGDAGTYVCRVSNGRVSVETKAILRVSGIIPRFNGESWVAMPSIKDAYSQFEIEISFKPTDDTGLILYNSQNAGRATDFLALQLEEGVPEFVLDTGSGPVSVHGDRPLSLNAWHTVRITKLVSQVTMDVDNLGPSIVEIPENWVLELRQPLYIGGVPDYDQLPVKIAGATGFAGCVSMLILGQEDKNIMMESLDQYRVESCDTCAGNTCQNDAVCQEARTERGYVCICNSEWAGADCERRGEACRPYLCGPGKCSDTADGYKCACPVTHTGRNCETRQQIEYPAFTGSAYVALKTPDTYRHLIMSMKVKATAPVSDGIIMYCAESPRGYGGFTALTVRNGHLEFRYDVGEGRPVILTSNTTLPENVWTDVQVTRSGLTVSMNINLVHNYEKKLDSAKSLNLETLMFIGGVDDTIVLNPNTGVNSGFMGCIKDLKTRGISVDIVNDPSIEAFNVKECSSNDPRGDIPEGDLCRCNNGGTCTADGTCYCPVGFTGATCESRSASSLRYAVRPPAPADPCAARPCRNGGTCRPNYSNNMNHTCDCPLGYAGASCQMRLDLGQSVGFNGNGYLELPSRLVSYEQLEASPAVIALRVTTVRDGVLAYQREALAPPDAGDYLLIRIERGHVVVDWDMGSGTTSLSVNSIDGKSGFVTDGEMHRIVVKLLSDGRVELTVDGISETGFTNGLSNRMGADSNIYIGGMPERLNINGFPSLSGCIDQVEFMDTGRGVNLGPTAVTARNTQPCNNMFLDVFPYLDEIDVFESPPPEFFDSAFSSRRSDVIPIILAPILLHLVQN